MRHFILATATLAASLSFAQNTFTFDSDNQGWTTIDLDTITSSGSSFEELVLGPVGPATWNPDGYIEGDDFANNGFYLSPFLGGGSLRDPGARKLTFDYWSDQSGPENAFVYLINSERNYVFAEREVLASMAFATLEFSLEDNTLWSNESGFTASTGDLESVIRNLNYIAISGDINPAGQDFTRLDNVQAVPEQGTMIALGAGALAMALRRRRKPAA